MFAHTLTVSKAAKRSGISRRTIQNAITRGDLPAHKTGERTAAWLINLRDFDHWLEERTPR